MNLEQAVFISALAGAGVMIWIASLALVLRLLPQRGTSIGLSLFLGALLGPVALIGTLVVLKTERRQVIDSPSLKAVLAPTALITLALLATFWVCRYGYGMTGEPLQWPLAQVLLLSGLVAGVLMAWIAQRVAFSEGLCVAALISILPLALSHYMVDLSTYGTSVAYFVAILSSGYLVLVLSLTMGGALGYLFLGDGKLSLAFGYESWIGRRFLMTKRSSNAISLITLISVIAVMVGCGGMVVVMSVMNGFSSDLRAKILGANAHLMVLKYGNEFPEYLKIIDKTRELKGVAGVSPFILNEVMVSSDNNLSGAVIKGIDVRSVAQVSLLRTNMVEGFLDNLETPKLIKAPIRVPKMKTSKKMQAESDRLAEAIAAASDDSAPHEDDKVPVLPGIVIGKEMARALHAYVGDVVNVVSPVGELGPTGPVPKAKAFRVAGIFYSGMYEYDSKFVYIALSEAQVFFGLKDSVTGIEFKVADIERTQQVAHELFEALGGYPYYTKDWMQMNRNLFSALKLEKIAMFIILMALIFMASLLILVALIMVVIEKGKEIAILKSMGASDSSIMKIFVTYGLSIGGLGAGLGLLLGFSLCIAIQSFGIGLDPEVYYITHIPVRIDPIEVGLVTLGAVIISFLATIPPSLFAARLKPVDGLRYE